MHTDIHTYIHTDLIRNPLTATLLTHAQLEHMRSEETIAQFLDRMRSLNEVVPDALEIHARIRLENILHGLSSPGGPLYPPRGVRARARKCMEPCCLCAFVLCVA